MPRILIVDDDPAVRSTLANVIASAGFEVLAADGGKQAMDLLRDNEVDLTIIDIFMPGVDGMEFIIRVRRQSPDAKIIAISGGGEFNMQNVLDIADVVGAERTLSKPFGPDDLLRAVREVLGLPESAPP